MEHFELEWKSFDGLALYAQGWQPAQPKAVVCLVHGLGEHSGRYAHLAEFLNQAGYAVLSFDNRGHGKSGGKRGHSPSFDAFMQDIDLLLAEAGRRYPGLPCFLYGHSLGGILVTNYVLRRKPKLAGVVVTSPGLRTALEAQKGKIALAKVLGALLPELSMPTGLEAKMISRDPAVVERYVKDPLVHGVATVGMAKCLLEGVGWGFEHAAAWHLPTLFMHGDQDQIAYLRGSQEFTAKIQGDCTLKIWPGLYHETHNEPEKDQVFAYLLDWLDKHLTS